MRHEFVVLLAVLVPVAFVYLAVGYESPRNQIALMAGASAYTLMALNIVLAARLPFVESATGGLDQLYKLHKLSGIAVLFLVVVHTQLKFVQLEGLVAPGSLAETSVEIAKPAFYLLVALLLISAVKRLPRLKFELPWQWWRMTHLLMGPLFLVFTFHQIFVKAPYDSTSAIRIWLNLLAVVAVASLIWTVIGPWLRKHRYEVTDVNRLAGATEVLARPLGRGLRAQAGQFAFLGAAKAGLREAHPFTLSRIGPDGTVGFCIQPAGDFTRRLRDVLQPGDQLRVEGGYGRFDFRRGGPRQVWIAGGIGITPFLAMAEALAESAEGREVVLFHVVREAELATGAERLRALATAIETFSFHLHDSSVDGRISAERLSDNLPFALESSEVWYCGPKGLREALQQQWQARGTTPRKVHHEEFEFR